ncbi:DUF3325 domain-containing protein [Niveispirillum sp. KHB5.9]|uniref:DUF3325 domain-containing protein n=1 Tax=Niveispirillum sp. KHB5.9 TaxID=3400269 RepID=UPI003A8568A2
MVAMFLLALLGCCFLGLSLSRHHAEVRGRFPRPAEETRWRAGGWLFLALSLAAAFLRTDITIAPVEWVALTTVAGLVPVSILTWRPRWLPLVMAVTSFLAIATLLAALA